MRLSSRRGALLLDVLVGLAVFSFVVTGVITAMLTSQRGMLGSGDRIRGVLLNQEILEAARSMRDADIASLTEGTHGIALSPAGLWELSGTGTVTEDGYVSSLTVEPADDGAVRIIATTVWSLGLDRNGETTAMTELSDWRVERDIGNWASISLEGAYVDDGTPLFNRAAVTGDTVFVTSEVSDGGAGLYVFDVTDLTAPERLAEGFDLGFPGYGLVVANDVLFVMTGDETGEIRAYDISDPAALSSDDLLGSVDVPGDATARSCVLYGNTLFVVSAEDATGSEVFAYDVTDPSHPLLLDDLDDSGSSFGGITLRDGYAYLASSNDAAELRVIDAFDPEDLSLAPGGGYNAADTPDANDVVSVGDYVLLARNAGSVTEELHLFDVSQSPVPASAPWNHETGESAYAVDADPTASFAFTATGNDTKEMIVLNIVRFAAGQNPEVASYNTSTGIGRGVRYSLQHDRVFLLTNSAFIILKPA